MFGSSTLIRLWDAIKSLSLPHGRTFYFDGTVLEDPMVVAREDKPAKYAEPDRD
jgi:hypothetical protein